MFPSDLLPSGFEDLWECCLLGQGGWGSAYLCRRGEEKVVLKVPKGFALLIEESGGDKPSGTSKELMKELMEKKKLMEKLEKVKYEAEAISKLDHPNIIKLLGYSKKAPLLIYEYADHGTLRWQLSKGWKPSQKDILLIGVELSDALRYIHSRGLVHGDIKPGNVFIKDGVIKLGDFSSIVMTLSSKSPSEILATEGFRAPEQVYDVLAERAKKEGYENRIDVYQLANLILYMLIGESIDGEYAIDEKRVKEKLNKVRNKELRKILDEALVLEPSKRPSSEELSKAFKTLYKIYEKTT
jgi:serine/threonine protein kinase